MKLAVTKELVISYQDHILKIAILRDGLLEELHEIDENNNSINVGDIYIGRIKKLKPELNSCFVNIGIGKNGFLHYHDLGRSLKSLLKFTNQVANGSIQNSNLNNFISEPEIDKNGKVNELFKSQDLILVQVVKEPISTKGPRLTSELSIAGRFIVLNPFGNKISVSKNIQSQEERERLKQLMIGILPKGFGVIIRTVSENKSLLDLHSDLNFLLNKWNILVNNLQKKKIPYRILSEIDKVQTILRDNFNDSYISIICDDRNLTKEFEDYLKLIAPDKKKIVKYYDNPIPLFENYFIERKIKQSFGKHVNIPNSKGSYLVIEHTEAMHVIDVNSGTVSSQDKTQERTALEVNLIAATEIARQLRLRDLGGIIIIDFIDMKYAENRKILYDHLKNAMILDKNKHKILPLTKFGLLQITRHRVRPQNELNTSEKIPNDGLIEAPIVMLERIENEIYNLLIQVKHEKIYLHVHPFIAAFLKIGFPSIRLKWFFKFKKWINIIERDAYKYLEYSFYNQKNEKI